jgi:RNA polymerase sigma factor (sigma-70 family)
MQTREERDAYIALLYNKHYDDLRRRCLRFVNYNIAYNDAIADCIQNTFVLAEQKFQNLEKIDYLGGWLMITCQHQLQHAIRQRKQIKADTVLSLDAENAPAIKDSIDYLDEWERKTDAKECIARIYQELTLPEKRVMRSHFLHGLSAREIAKKDQVTEGSIKAVINRIRTKAKRQKK